MDAARAIVNVVKSHIQITVRYGLIAYFLLVILEGAVRKWLLPSANQYIYILKDALLVLLCTWVVMSSGRIPIPRVIRNSKVGQLIIVFAVYCILEGINYNLPGIRLGIWGIRTYFVPMNLVWLIPLGFPDTRMNEKLLRRYVLLGIPMALLCFVQYRLPTVHILNRYANTDTGKSVAVVAGAVRVTGTFSYITGLGTYLNFQLAVLLGILFAGGWRVRGNRLIWLTLALSVAMVPMTGARANAVYLVLQLGIVAVVSNVSRQNAAAQSRFLLAGICVAALSIAFFSEAFERLGKRASRATDTRARIESLVLQPFSFLDYSGFFGFGAAATHQAAPVLVPGGGSYYWLPTRDFEDEAGRVMLELGAIGFAIYIALKVSVCVFAYEYIAKYGHAVPLVLPVAFLLLAACCLTTGMIFNSIGSSFYWGLFGLFVTQVDSTRIKAR